MKELFGREAEARTLINNTEQRHSSLLIADSGMGKTALIQYISLVLKEIGKPIFCERVGPGFATFLKEVYTGLFEHGIVRSEEVELSEALKAWSRLCPSNDDKAKFLCDRIAEHSDVIVVIDDCNAVTANNRHWLEYFAEHATVIACIESRSLSKHRTKRFWKRFDEIDLQPLSKEASRAFVEVLMERYHIVADDVEIYKRKVLDLSQGSPYELHRLVKYHSSDNLVKTSEISGHTQQFVDRDVKQLALAPLLLIFGIILVASRYVARARADMDLYVVAGITLVVMIVLGPFVRNALKPRSR